MPPVGLLLSNLGTPEAPTAAAVRPYLRQFLTDKRVLDMPWLLRQLIVRGVIAPFRSARSAHAYAKIWTPEGSPLLVHSERLTKAVATKLGEDWKVVLGMRYGKPSLGGALDSLLDAGCHKILLLPLYPQYALVTTGSTVEEIWRLSGKLGNPPDLRVMPSFPLLPGFIQAQADRIAPLLERGPDEHVLFSFHGIPERQIRKADGTGTCLTGACCETFTDANRLCYKAQCHATTRAIASKLGLAKEGWTISFQSRIGRDPWIGPYTQQTAVELAGKGVKRLVVATPAFVADCLETLEEISIGVRASFLNAGGASFACAPCVNSDEGWIDAVVRMATSYLDQQS
jgi:ferrochelatase